MVLEKQFKNISLSRFLEEIWIEDYFWIVKRLTGNDTGLTGGHQVGLYLPKYFFNINFPEICTTKIFNPDSLIEEAYIPSHDYYVKNLRAVYYNSKYHPDRGLKKKYDEFRITRWGGKKSPTQSHDNTGGICLFAVKRDNGKVKALCWVANNIEEETTIENWIGSEVEPGRFYSLREPDDLKEIPFVDQLPEKWFRRFPSGTEIFNKVIDLIPRNGWRRGIDKLLLERRNIEFSIFKELEQRDVLPKIKGGFKSVDDFIKYSLSVANRRKSRTGLSLELNLINIFTEEGLNFETQAITEQKKKPDFLFPSQTAYHDMNFQSHKLHMLAAKTCCKDRWRQIVTEANRIDTKHLFTLQEGISENQLSEMYAFKVKLVVPQPYIKSFPKEFQTRILNLDGFINIIKQSQST